MKLQVTVANEVFEVEIADLQARPVCATIDGEVFEVWPEEVNAAAANSAAPAAPPPPTAPPRARPAPRAANRAAAGANAVLAPLPGVLLSVAVQPGDTVTVGQPLCVLEAMKMNNTIRAARAGRIAAIRATVGQAVQHRQVLLEYEAAAPEPA